MTIPRVFWSYSRADNEYDDDAILQLRDKLVGEFKIQTGGAPIDVFVDQKDIGWGEDWREKLNTELTDALFIIPVFSPNFLNSDTCRREILKFLELERVRNRKDLILPIYYVTEDRLHEDQDHLLEVDQRVVTKAIRDHQYVDWRRLRHAGFVTPESRSSLGRLASLVKDAIARTSPRPQGAVSADRNAHVFDSKSPAFHADLGALIAKARAGESIRVRPGVHDVAGLDIAVPIEICGDEDHPETCVLRLTDGSCMRWNANGGGLSGVEIHAAAGRPAIQFNSPKAVLSKCVVCGSDSSALELEPKAIVTLNRCRISGGRYGIEAVHQSTLEVNDTEISGCAPAGIRAWIASLSIRNTSIRGNAEGVWIGPDTKGTFDGCDLTGNRAGPGTIMRNASVTFRNTKGADLLRHVDVLEQR